MAEVIPLNSGVKQLPNKTSNKRFKEKAQQLEIIKTELQTICDNLQLVDIGCLVHIPLLDSSSLSLYNALIESLELDVKRITEYTER